MKKREMLSFLTISFCHKGCTFLFINMIMCINQKSHQYLHFLFILKYKSFSSHTKVVARNSKSNILGDFLCSENKQFLLSCVTRPLGLYYNHYMSPSVRQWSISEKYAKR